jgi:hypothetical protein
MNGLIATPAAPIDPANAVVVADDWFPPVKLADIRAALHLGGGIITTAHLTTAIEGGMLHAMKELADWRSGFAALGFAALDQVEPGKTLNGKSQAVLLWEKAVRHFAAAEIYEQHKYISVSADGLDRAAEKLDTADKQRRLALAAITDLLSMGGDPVPRNAVELI